MYTTRLSVQCAQADIIHGCCEFITILASLLTFPDHFPRQKFDLLACCEQTLTRKNGANKPAIRCAVFDGKYFNRIFLQYVHCEISCVAYNDLRGSGQYSVLPVHAPKYSLHSFCRVSSQQSYAFRGSCGPHHRWNVRLVHEQI